MKDRSADSASRDPQATAENRTAVAKRLWSILDQLHTDYNALARSKPNAKVSDLQANIINGTLRQIHELLGPKEAGGHLRLIPEKGVLTNADVLVVLSSHKGALRNFRINVLGESQFTI